MLNHIKFDLVPAYKSGWIIETIYIPAPKSDYTDWVSTDPNGFNQKLTDKNNSNSSLIKPMIRLVKYWNARNDYVYYSYELEQTLVELSYWSCYNLKDYFFDAIKHLPTWGLPQYKAEKVQRAKDIVDKTIELEEDNMPNSAESEIKKLIPAF